MRSCSRNFSFSSGKGALSQKIGNFLLIYRFLRISLFPFLFHTLPFLECIILFSSNVIARIYETSFVLAHRQLAQSFLSLWLAQAKLWLLGLRLLLCRVAGCATPATGGVMLHDARHRCRIHLKSILARRHSCNTFSKMTFKYRIVS